MTIKYLARPLKAGQKWCQNQNLVRFTWKLHTSQVEATEYESDIDVLKFYI